MEPAICPVCFRFVGHVPNGWRVCIVHHEEPLRHALTTERPPSAEERPNPD